MSGWHWFWTLVCFVVYIIVLMFLYFSKPFEQLFGIVVNGLSFHNVMLWAAVVVAIIGFCAYHWRAYRVHIVGGRSAEAMVLASLRGSTFVAILLSGGAMLQAVQSLCVHLLENATLGAEFGKALASVVALVILTGVFCLFFGLLKVVRGTADSVT